jgi:SpoVK/Ycf46/Vps4 family AAA+-type ATPase
VGETEGNLEKILKVLRVMGPVAVIIDEADAMLGDRQSGSDSGTSSRVFGQFATQMGNTDYRGKIIWFLLTCRPDLLPIDIKRQGRCEVHIPLFYPATEQECREMFVVMGKKNKIDIDEQEVPSMPAGLTLSGADIEGIANRAKRLSLLDGSGQVSREHLQKAVGDFIPSAQSDEKQLQILAAVLESTDVNYLPDHLRQEVLSVAGRSEMLSRFKRLQLSLEG